MVKDDNNKSPKKILEAVNHIESVWNNYYEMFFTIALGLCMIFNLNPLNFFGGLLFTGKKGGLIGDGNIEIYKTDERAKPPSTEMTGRMRQNERRRQEKALKMEAEAKSKLANSSSDLSKGRQ